MAENNLGKVRGEQGYQGNQGSTGNQGLQGVQGNQGIQGSAGSQGYQGNQGQVGAQGYQGESGGESPININVQAGTTYTLVLSDVDKLIRMTNVAASTLTIPPNSSVAFTIGDILSVMQSGDGVITFTPGAGVTLYSYLNGYDSPGKHSMVQLIKINTDTWVLVGGV